MILRSPDKEPNTPLQGYFSREATVADLRIHGTTKRQVAQLFAEEKQDLLALPASLFPVFQEGPRLVHRDSYVEVAKAYYAERKWRSKSLTVFLRPVLRRFTGNTLKAQRRLATLYITQPDH